MRSDPKLRLRMSALVLLPLLAACSISASVSTSVNAGLASISDSFNAISNSSTSGGSEATAMYQQDVRAYTRVFVAQGGTEREFTRGLSRIAEDHGITHWEAEAATMQAVGAGLADGNATAAQVERLCESLTDGARARLVREGFLSAQR
jgi:hypothetical protein